jgi:uncharacterized membrane protein
MMVVAMWGVFVGAIAGSPIIMVALGIMITAVSIVLITLSLEANAPTYLQPEEENQKKEGQGPTC